MSDREFLVERAMPGPFNPTMTTTMSALCRLLIPIVLATSVAACTSMPTATSGASDFEIALLTEDSGHAIAMANAGRDDEAADALRDIVADPAFDAMPNTDRRAVLATLGIVQARAGRLEDALALLRRAVDADPDEPYSRYLRSTLEYDLGRPQDSAKSLAYVLERWPALSSDVGARHAVGLAMDHDIEPEARMSFMQALFNAEWDSRLPGAGRIWYELALEHLRRNDPGSAAPVVQRITHPMIIVRMLADRRFDVLELATNPAMDVEDAAMIYARDLRTLATSARPPEGIVSELSYALLMSGRNDELIELADERLDRSIGDTRSESPRETTDAAWLMNNRAIALRRLSRNEDALRDLQAASAMAEGGSSNVSHVLNLAWFYCNLGRPADALKTLARVGEMSGYGRLVDAAVKNWAAVLSNDPSGAEEALAYLRAHRADGPLQFLDSLVRTDRLEEAAEMLIDQLETEDQRGDALEWSQSFLRPDALPGDDVLRRNRFVLLERKDVRAKIDEVGRIGRFDIYGDPGTD